MGLFGSTSARHDKTFEVEHSEEEWRRRLTPEQYRVLREHGTERGRLYYAIARRADKVARLAP